jgi:hypothetical protein
MKWVALLALLLCAPRADANVPRRGVRHAALVVAPGLNEAGWARAAAGRPEMLAMRKHALVSGPDEDLFFSEHALGFELATGCAHAPPASRSAPETLFAVWRAAGRATAAVTSSCLLSPLLAPFAVSSAADGSLENALALLKGAETPLVWLGGRAGALDPRTAGDGVPKCVAENATQLAACVARADAAEHVVGAFGDPASVFARRCMFLPAGAPSAADLVRAAVAALDAKARAEGWFLLVELNGVDRAAHANDTAKMARALDEVGEVVAALRARLAGADGEGALAVTGGYDAGGFDGAAFASVTHVAGGSGVLRSAGARLEEAELPEPARVRDVAAMFSPAIGCAAAYKAPLGRHNTLTISFGSPLALVAVGTALAVTILLVSVFIYRFSKKKETFRNSLRRHSDEGLKPHAYASSAGTHLHARGTQQTRARADSKT